MVSQSTTNKNSVYTWGFGKTGALGTGKQQSEILPVKIIFEENIVDVSAGLHCSMCVGETGQVYSFGCNKQGRIGIGNVEESLVPKKIDNLTKIISVSCGKKHSLALSREGIVFSTGYNKHGELGLGNILNSDKFLQIENLGSIVKISAGSISLFLNNSGQLFSSGKGGLNGFKDNKDRLTPTIITSLTTENIVDCNSGYSHSCCVSAEGSIFSWGIGSEYQLGHGNKKDVIQPKKIEHLHCIVKQASCTVGEKHAHTGCVDSNGMVYTWGNGYKSKLGHNDTDDQAYPKAIKAIENVKITRIFCGGIHTAILSEDCRLFTFGCGSDGRLGHPESEKYNVLYKETIPREIEAFKGMKVIDASCNYYHCIALCN